MANHVSRVLSRGIARLAEGQTVEQYMGHVDVRALDEAQREELLQLLQTSARLLPLRHVAVPPPRAKAANRARFLGMAVQEKEGKPAVGLGRGLSLPAPLRRALVGVFISLALLVLAGTGAVSVAADSLPGSTLYPLKLAVEDARLTLAPSSPTRSKLYLRFASERTREMLRLAAAGRSADPTVVARLSQQLEGALQSAQAAADEQQRVLLLQDVVQSSTAQQESLSRAREQASPDVQPMLEVGAQAAAQTSEEAQKALENLPPPSATPTPEISATATATEPAVVLPASPTPVPSDTQPPAATPTDTARPQVAKPTATPKPSATASFTPEPEIGPSATPTSTATSSPAPTHTATATPSPVTPTLTNTPSPTATPEPTDTPPAAVFRLINEDNPDPVPASHRIHYVVCAMNDGEVPLTNVKIVVTWSPRECLYLLPGNPADISWDIGTVEPHTRGCGFFALNTYSTCGGRTAVSSAVMTCDQGSAQAVQYTRIAGTPTPTSAPTEITTPTPTATHTATATPTSTIVPSPTATETLEPTVTVTATETLTPTLTLTPGVAPTDNTSGF